MSVQAGVSQCLTKLQMLALPSRSPGKGETKLESRQEEQLCHHNEASDGDSSLIFSGVMSQHPGLPVCRVGGWVDAKRRVGGILVRQLENHQTRRVVGWGVV